MSKLKKIKNTNKRSNTQNLFPSNSIKSTNEDNLNDSSKYLKCMYTNATSLNNKFAEFSTEVETRNPDIIMICETWCTENSIVSLPGYNLFRKDRSNRVGGGVCIYILKIVLDHIR